MSKAYGEVVFLILEKCICTVYALCTKAELVGWHHVLGICSHQLLQENGQAEVGRARVAAISVVVFFLRRLYLASASTQLSHSCKALTVPHHWPPTGRQ